MVKPTMLALLLLCVGGGCSVDEDWEGEMRKCVTTDPNNPNPLPPQDTFLPISLFLEGPLNPEPRGFFGYGYGYGDSWYLLPIRESQLLGPKLTFAVVSETTSQPDYRTTSRAEFDLHREAPWIYRGTMHSVLESRAGEFVSTVETDCEVELEPRED